MLISVTGSCLFLSLTLLFWLAPERQAESQDPTSVFLDQAQEALDGGKIEEAADLLGQVLKLQEKHKAAREALVDALMQLGRWEDAQNHLQYLVLHFPEDVTVRLLEAAVVFRTGDFVRAARLAEEMLKRGDRRSEAYKLAALSHFMAGDLQRFQDRLSEALEFSPQDAELHYHLGRYYYEVKNYSQALLSFERTIQLSPESFRAHYFAALIQQSGGNRAGAEAHFRKAIEVIEKRGLNYAWPYADLGQLLVDYGEFDNGLGWLYRAIRNDPSLPYAHFAFAGALLKKDELSVEVELALQRALQLDPGYAEAFYLLGRYYARAGERERAEEAFSRFRELRGQPLPSPFGLRR